MIYRSDNNLILNDVLAELRAIREVLEQLVKLISAHTADSPPSHTTPPPR